MDLVGIRRAFEGEVVERVLRAAGVQPVTTPLFQSAEGLGSANGSYQSNISCNLLVDEANLKDGKIPQVLGIALVAWLVSIDVLWRMLLGW